MTRQKSFLHREVISLYLFTLIDYIYAYTYHMQSIYRHYMHIILHSQLQATLWFISYPSHHLVWLMNKCQIRRVHIDALSDTKLHSHNYYYPSMHLEFIAISSPRQLQLVRGNVDGGDTWRASCDVRIKSRVSSWASLFQVKIWEMPSSRMLWLHGDGQRDANLRLGIFVIIIIIFSSSILLAL